MGAPCLPAFCKRPEPVPFRLLFIVSGLVIGVVGLAIDYAIIMGSAPVTQTGEPIDRGVIGQHLYFWTFFTHLTNGVLVLIYLAELTGLRLLSWFRNTTFQASMAANIALVMVFFHFMLAPYFTFTGGLLIANYLLHYVAPILYLVWWIAFARHGALRFAHVPLLLAFGMAYLAWALLRGAVVGEYPYAILDPTLELPGGGVAGYLGVAIGTGVVLACVAAFCILIVFMDKFLARRHLGKSA